MTQQRRIVFFLGAGASLGAGAVTNVQHGGKIKIPTQDTFWDTFLRFSSAANRATIERFLFRYFRGYKQAPTRASSLSKRKLLTGIDVEEVFTFLSERNTAPRVSPQLKAHTEKVWIALLSEIGHVFGRFGPTPNTRRVYRAFKRQHVRHWD